MSAEATESLPTELPSEAVIFGCTAAMREVRAKIEIALCNATPVLIQGESGTELDAEWRTVREAELRCDDRQLA